MSRSSSRSDARATAADAQRLLAVVRAYESCVVAFSGGVDSALVAVAAHKALGDRALAVTAHSPSLASGELDTARDLANAFGMRHRVMRTEELHDTRYAANDRRRCYFCKSKLYRQLIPLAEREGFAVVANGANLDDLGDYRPGMQAADERNVHSPLVECRITKRQVRRLAAAWEIPVWDKPAMPCLASRIAYGVPVTDERLRRIDAAEAWFKARGFPIVRVRCHEGELARVEVPLDDLPRLQDPRVRPQAVEALLQLGFEQVQIDPEGFRSGRLNQWVPLETLETPSDKP